MSTSTLVTVSAQTPAISLAPFISQKHPFHILGPSPFPLRTGFFLFLWLVPQVFARHGWYGELYRADLIHASLLGLYCNTISWFFAILKESRQGYHTKRVQNGLRLGRLLFIVSEVRFFFAFFWSFFHYSLVPSIAIGAVWPPFGTQALDPWGLPLVNTLLLLTSGLTITIAHACIVKNNPEGFSWYLFLTIILGGVFLFCQAYEYKYGVKFSWRGNIYGSIFFITTGFHGFHVTLGTRLLLFCWLRHLITVVYPAWVAREHGTRDWWVANQRRKYSRTPKNHFGFEAAAWYWHFVDVVWLFLFLSIYWWGTR